MTNPNTEKCDTDNTLQSIISVETGKDAFFNLPQQMIFENIIMDFENSTSSVDGDSKDSPVTDPD